MEKEEEKKVNQAIHNQLDFIIGALIRGEVEPSFNTSAFVEECKTLLSNAVTKGQATKLKNIYLISPSKYDLLKSFLLVKQSRLLLNGFHTREAYMKFMEDLILHLSKIIYK